MREPQCRALRASLVRDAIFDLTYFSTFGLLTLHGCGDLTPSVMRLFAESDAARALVCVGCCYQKVNLSLTRASSVLSKPPLLTCLALLSFPMSQRVKTLLTECKSNDWYAGLLQTATESPRSFFHMKEKELKERERKLALRAIFEVALRESCQGSRQTAVSALLTPCSTLHCGW